MPAQNTAAKPPGFLLKMRLIQPDGMPFFRRDFRVRWMATLYPPLSRPPFQTDSHGSLSVLLPEPTLASPVGHIEFVDRYENLEIVRWALPIRLADAAPLSPIPAIAEAPILPPPTASPSEQADYRQRHRTYISEAVKIIRENLGEIYRFWNEVDEIVALLPDAPLSTTSDDELWAAWENLTAVHAVLVAGYEAAYRLWNLGDLPILQEPELMFLASDYEMLLRALDRFAFRHELAPLPSTPTPEAMRPILDKLMEAHDQRGLLQP